MASIFKGGSKKYYISYIDFTEDGREKRKTVSSKTTDKKTATQIANRLEAEVALKRRGVIDTKAEALALRGRQTIESHLVHYENHLVSKGNSKPHIERTIQCIRNAATFCKWIKLDDISADSLNEFSRNLKTQKSRSVRTIQAHLTACKSFTRWLWRDQKIAIEPLSSITRPNAHANRKRRRRMLLPDEWLWLIKACNEGPVRYQMTGKERRLLYDTAIQTGYRNNELRKLTQSSLVVEGKAWLVLQASGTKNRKDAKQFLNRTLAEELRGLLRENPTRRFIFPMPDRTKCAQMLRKDLEFARSLWLATFDEKERAEKEKSDFLKCINQDGESLDFHSLRHTCGAWLAKAKVQPKVIQTVMRHATITLTMDTYGHLFPDEVSNAIDQQRSVIPNQ